MRTLNSPEHPADFCRANGWDVGTRLISDEGASPMVIEITALGERMMLAKRVRNDGEPSHESSWTLSAREWVRIDESGAGLPQGAASRALAAAESPAAVTDSPRRAITPLVTMLAPFRDLARGESSCYSHARLLDALEAVDAELIERAACYGATANRLKRLVVERNRNCDPEEAARYDAYAVAARSTITAVRVRVAFALDPLEDL